MVPLSVTGLIHKYSRGFDAVQVIRGMRAETRQRYTDGGLLSEAEIIDSWTRNGTVPLEKWLRDRTAVEPRVDAFF